MTAVKLNTHTITKLFHIAVVGIRDRLPITAFQLFSQQLAVQQRHLQQQLQQPQQQSFKRNCNSMNDKHNEISTNNGS